MYQMEQIILAVGTGLIGGSLGLLIGMFMRKYMSPRAQELQKAMEENESYYKTMVARLKARFKEYEQPSELQRFANQTQGENPADLVGLLSSELANIRGMPKWVRPFIPAIQGWLKENPEQVQALINKFLTPHKGAQDLNTDAL